MKMLLLLAAATALSAAQAPVTRGVLVPVEQRFDDSLKRLNLDDPFFLIGPTRAVYLEGYGIVLTAEVNLANMPGISPFHPKITKEDIDRVHNTKLQRLPKLKELMREMLVNCASELGKVPENERVAIAVSLPAKPGEDTTGLPAQILMLAPRKDLLAARGNASALASAVQVREY